jgi:hypothetical protein
MFLKIDKNTFIDSKSIISIECEERKLNIYLANVNPKLDVIYDTEEECFNTFEKLIKVLSVKDININIPKKQKTPEEDKKILFEQFWNTYNKKTGIEKCKKKFFSYDIKTIAEILKSVPQYVKNTSNVKYRKNPLTWLNGEHWKDEYTNETEHKKPKQNFNYEDLF